MSAQYDDKGLTNVYIETFLHKYCKKFFGCFSSNNLPTNMTDIDSFSIICNLSKRNEEGTHFITIIC